MTPERAAELRRNHEAALPPDVELVAIRCPDRLASAQCAIGELLDAVDELMRERAVLRAEVAGLRLEARGGSW